MWRYDSLFIIGTSLLLLLHNDPAQMDISIAFPEALSCASRPASHAHTRCTSLLVFALAVLSHFINEVCLAIMNQEPHVFVSGNKLNKKCTRFKYLHM